MLVVGVPVSWRTAFLPLDTAAFVNVSVKPVVALTATDWYPAIACWRITKFVFGISPYVPAFWPVTINASMRSVE